MTDAAARAAEQAARSSYGRLLATLTARTHNIAAAEDALAEAFAAALRVWPRTGVPDRPEAWLVTAARRAVGHAERHRGVQDAARGTLEMMYDAMQSRTPPEFPDDRLRLLFTCAHPAIDEAIRTPLMLQTVLGLDAVRIGAAFVVPGSTMGQRLSRAKTKIRDAGIPFRTPDPADLPHRLADVLAAIYAAYGTGWDAIGGAEGDGTDLVQEAVFLARLLAEMLPDQPEPKGLLALILYCEARRPARRGPDGAYVPLRDQDRALWLSELVIEAEGLLAVAATARSPGRFQLEAALQSLHITAPRGAAPDPRALVALHDMLVRFAPTLGARVSRAIAYAERDGPAAGLHQLAEIPQDRVAGYQPYWAARLHLETAMGADPSATRDRALALTTDPAVRRWLAAR